MLLHTPMKKQVIFILLLFTSVQALALQDSVIVPIYRQLFHDKINEEQLQLDKLDGKADGVIKVSSKPDINLAVSDALIRKIDALQNQVEKDTLIKTNNEKVRNLGYIENLLKGFRSSWKTKEFNPLYTPLLVETFEKVLSDNVLGKSMVPIINEAPYQVNKIIIEIFVENMQKKLLNLEMVRTMFFM